MKLQAFTPALLLTLVACGSPDNDQPGEVQETHEALTTAPIPHGLAKRLVEPSKAFGEACWGEGGDPCNGESQRGRCLDLGYPSDWGYKESCISTFPYKPAPNWAGVRHPSPYIQCFRPGLAEGIVCCSD